MRIDVHNHIIPTSVGELFARDPRFGVSIEGGTWRGGMHVDFEVTGQFTDPEAKIAELTANGIDAAVLSVIPPLFYYHLGAEAGGTMAEAANPGLADFAETNPDRFRWLATVPLQSPTEAAEILGQAVRDGAVGAEIGSNVDGTPLDAPALDRFWAAADRLDVPVLIHPAYNEPHRRLDDFYLQNVIGNQLETTIAVECLICAGVLDRHPALRILLVHAGGYFPFQAGRLRHARTVRPELADAPADPFAYVDRIWFDTITHDPAALRFLVDRVGVAQVVLGTDLPFDMARRSPLDLLEAALDRDEVERVSELNPAALFGFR